MAWRWFWKEAAAANEGVAAGGLSNMTWRTSRGPEDAQEREADLHDASCKGTACCDVLQDARLLAAAAALLVSPRSDTAPWHRHAWNVTRGPPAAMLDAAKSCSACGCGRHQQCRNTMASFDARCLVCGGVAAG